MIKSRSKGLVLMICLFAGPFLQLVGDVLWLTHKHNFSWNLWREASYIFFIPVGFLFSRLMERKSFWWAVSCCALFVTGCIGAAAMMPLFRLGAFYPSTGHNALPTIVNSVLDKQLFGATLYPLGLCFPVSLALFGVASVKFKSLQTSASISLIVCGVLFWLGNAGEIDTILIIGDAFLLFTCCYIGYSTIGIFKGRSARNAVSHADSAIVATGI